MAFQLFGYRFEVRTELPPAELKARIKARKSRLFEMKNGARGWILGPFVCLWFSAFDSYGPMLFGRISVDQWGTRLGGRTGLDLNGLALSTAISGALAISALVGISRMQSLSDQLVMLGLISLVAIPIAAFVLWAISTGHKNAEPLVSFLRQVSSHRSGGRTAAQIDLSPEERSEMRLILNGGVLPGSLTPDALSEAFLRVGNGDFLIVEAGPEDYIQSASTEGRYVVEKREGSAERHFEAFHDASVDTDETMPRNLLLFEDALAIMSSHVFGTPAPDSLRWERWSSSDGQAPPPFPVRPPRFPGG